MSIYEEVGSTNYALLRLLRNFNEQFAWSQFLEIYNPMIRNCCRCRGLNTHEVDEVQSLVSGRLLSFFSKSEQLIHTSFRGYLARLVENEINTYLSQKRNDRLVPLTDMESYMISEADRDNIDELETRLSSKLLFIAKVIEIVKLRVNNPTWSIFWDYAVLNHSVEEVAGRHGVSKSTVFKNHHRVTTILAQVAKQKSHA